MPQDPFANFGLAPIDLPEPPARLRSELTLGYVIGQYIFTTLLAATGLGITALFTFQLPRPINVAAAVLMAGLFAYFIHLATRHDRAWVELDGDTLRAKHLYTRRVIERNVRDIDDVLTIVWQMRTLATVLAERLLGRVRGVHVRLTDGTRLLINRNDPTMTNAKEMIQAILYRMSQHAPLEYEIVDFRGAPMLRRVYWKTRPDRPATPPAVKKALS